MIIIQLKQKLEKQVLTEKIEESLNSSHYGLDKAKTRIIEHIAVSKNTKNKVPKSIFILSPTLLLVFVVPIKVFP